MLVGAVLVSGRGGSRLKPEPVPVANLSGKSPVLPRLPAAGKRERPVGEEKEVPAPRPQPPIPPDKEVVKEKTKPPEPTPPEPTPPEPKPVPAEPRPAPPAEKRRKAIREKLPPLLKGLKAKTLAGRRTALETIADLGEDGAEASADLIEALADRSPVIQQAALNALEKVNPTLHTPVLSLLVDRDPKVKLRAVAQLGKLGADAKPAISLLVRFYQAQTARPDLRLRAGRAGPGRGCRAAPSRTPSPTTRRRSASTRRRRPAGSP
jgi:hypothetical protein